MIFRVPRGPNSPMSPVRNHLRPVSSRKKSSFVFSGRRKYSVATFPPPRTISPENILNPDLTFKRLYGHYTVLIWMKTTKKYQYFTRNSNYNVSECLKKKNFPPKNNIYMNCFSQARGQKKATYYKYLLDWVDHWRCSFLRPSWWVEFELLEEEVQLLPDEFHHYPWWYRKRKIQSNRSPVRVASLVRIWQSREYRGTRGHLRTRAIGHAHQQWHAYSWRWERPE